MKLYAIRRIRTNQFLKIVLMDDDYFKVRLIEDEKNPNIFTSTNIDILSYLIRGYGNDLDEENLFTEFKLELYDLPLDFRRNPDYDRENDETVSLTDKNGNSKFIADPFEIFEIGEIA